jgi:small subunit ribosomal protein S3
VGQKVNPVGLRIGIAKDWGSRWFAPKKNYAEFLNEDVCIRKYIYKTFTQAMIAKVEIERAGDRVRIIIHSARPALIIGRRGAEVDRLREDLQKITKNKEVYIDIQEVKEPLLSAKLVADNVAYQIEKRVSYKRAMKKSIELSMNAGAKGIKITCSGRLAGAEMAREETRKAGKIPLSTLRADIDYAYLQALTIYGTIGVKVWIYRGELPVQKT